MRYSRIYDRAIITKNTINITTTPIGINTLAQSGFSACRLFSIVTLTPGQKKNTNKSAPIPNKICSQAAIVTLRYHLVCDGQLNVRLDS